MIRSIHGRSAFVRLRADGVRVRSGPLWCTMVADRSFSSAQVAFSLPRAVGTAVERNRVRRRLRALLRERPLAPGLYLWGAGAGATALSFADLGRHVDTLLERAQSRWSSSHPVTESARRLVGRSTPDPGTDQAGS